jgi:hypothetical protein
MTATEGAAGLSTAAIEACIAHRAYGWHRPEELAAARAELVALVEAAGRAAALAAACALPDIDRALADLGVATTPTIVPDERRRAAAETVRTFLRVLRTVVAVADAGPGAAGARDETALLDAAARYQDAWRVLAAGDATEDAKVAHILDMHEAREDLFDATEVALRAGGAGETDTEGT